MEGVEAVPLSRVSDLKNDQTRMHLVGAHVRPGVLRFATMFEWVYFKPGTSDEHRFQMLVVRWEGIDFFVVSFPMSFAQVVDRFLAVSDLVMTDGIPTLLGDGPPKFFPADGPTVFSLENRPGSAVYDDPAAFRHESPVRRQEAEFCAWVRATEGAHVHHVLEGMPAVEAMAKYPAAEVSGVEVPPKGPAKTGEKRPFNS